MLRRVSVVIFMAAGSSRWLLTPQGREVTAQGGREKVKWSSSAATKAAMARSAVADSFIMMTVLGNNQDKPGWKVAGRAF